MTMHRTSGRRNSGMVLIITLLGLAIVTLLLLALFAGASHQMVGAQTDALLARERLLADSAVALVVGQIEAASTQTNQAWISQPGLLRTYGATSVRAPTACYKLYSTPLLTNMIDTSGTMQFLTNEVPSNWSGSPSQYVDMNAAAATNSVTSEAIYPILDPATLTNSANAAAGTQIEGVSSDTGSVTMPVAWLYELQDGTLGSMTNATAQNPIVARVAFWTDDDTCKVNINTAGDGSPWETPRFNSTNDVAWSTTQPAQGEYSAYPGHPATTSLAALGTNFTAQQLLAFTPRYAWGGSEFGTQTTTTNEVVLPKTDRLYASADELAFSTNTDSSGNRETNAITPTQLERAGFVLTADSVAPETTLLGEPRVAIWPVADSTTNTAPRMTATDEAITNAATVGAGTTNMRSYYFLRNNPQNQLDDFSPSSTNAAAQSNVALFDELLARGNVSLPGYGTTFLSKYPDPEWTQLVLEMVDYIHALNAIDPNASAGSSFVPFAPGDSTGAGRGFVEPLTWAYGTGTNAITLRGLGRCPTLSSLTLVFYVAGFNFKNGSYVDYEQTPDSAAGTNWNVYFQPASTNWPNVISERVRAFVIPCTDQPGCGYPEVSDACTIQIQGLNALKVSNYTNTGSFGFPGTITSRLLSDVNKVTPPVRAWGGNEGPLAWRAASIDAQQSTLFTNTFMGTNSFPVSLTNSYNAATGLKMTPKATAITFTGTLNLTVLIQDSQGNTLQTLAASFPSPGCPVPLPVAEFSQDGSGNSVAPSYYMTLGHRALLTGTNREFLIQPGDTSRSVEAGTDLRVIDALTNVPAALFKTHPSYLYSTAQHAQNLHFEDGTAAYGAAGTNTVLSSSFHLPTTTTVTWTNWCNGAASNYAWPVSPPCSTPAVVSASTVIMGSGTNGDWDTGPGLSPDGAEINLPDAGTTNSPAAAYFSLSGGAPGAPTQRTPNALVPSPVIFGSLPVGINPGNPTNSTPWRTLLFCPYPACNNTSTPYAVHPGAASPPDHLILDNFWMPVVEPYPISTCMATEGKINLNNQIAPFTYLHRNTALHALLTSLRIPAVSATMAGTYKTPGPASTAAFWNQVDENATIAQIENRFAGGSADAYLSESEICTVPIVPVGQNGGTVAATQANLESFWNGFAAAGGLTGKNLRELPYAQLYGRLTTRSNSYTVHVRAQILQKLPGDPQQNVWKEGTDLVLGEWRGSYQIERYLDPAAPAPQVGVQLGPYRYRILSCHRFTP